MATVYPEAPRLLPTCSLSHGTCALNRPDQGHAIKAHRDIPLAHPIPDLQMKHVGPICTMSVILGCAPILMTYFTGLNHKF